MFLIYLFILFRECEQNLIRMMMNKFHLGRPSKAKAFTKLIRYHTRTPQFNLWPENVHFGKRNFRGRKIGAKIFLKNLYQYQAQLFMFFVLLLLPLLLYTVQCQVEVQVLTCVQKMYILGIHILRTL